MLRGSVLILIRYQKPFHSHNDYWRDLPFYSALRAGAVSVEADVWLINGTLYVRLVTNHVRIRSNI